MATAMRTILYRIEESGMTPDAPQYAGVQGEHHATKVEFELPISWNTQGYIYRVEYEDGWQNRHVSPPLTPVEGRVWLLLPDSWTAAGGTGEIRLEASRADGEDMDEQRIYTPAGHLYFHPRDGWGMEGERG